jgi:hypothetical protein
MVVTGLTAHRANNVQLSKNNSTRGLGHSPVKTSDPEKTSMGGEWREHEEKNAAHTKGGREARGWSCQRKLPEGRPNKLKKEGPSTRNRGRETEYNKEIRDKIEPEGKEPRVQPGQTAPTGRRHAADATQNATEQTVKGGRRILPLE